MLDIQPPYKPFNEIDTYAVFGNPIAHSKSPFIHTEFAKQTQQRLQYIKILAPLDQFSATVAEFKANGGKGLNITVPFKLEAYRLANELSERAQLAEAVNTLVFRADGSLYGDNTDGIGLVRDLTTNYQLDLTKKRILIAGAGGSTQGILAPLLQTKPATIMLANRDVNKAINLAKHFNKIGKIAPVSYADLNNEAPFDLIINATSASLSDAVPTIPTSALTPATWCYDLAYGNSATAFQRWAQEHGVKHAVDGLGMLVEQAAESFYLWRGIKPNTSGVIKLLRQK